jgi:PqqD family protein of HPr-rel-A system
MVRQRFSHTLPSEIKEHIVKCHFNLRPLLLNDNGFAFDPGTGLSYTLSSTSMRVIAWLKAGCREEELPARLADEYDAPPHVVERDVENFLSSLRACQLL